MANVANVFSASQFRTTPNLLTLLRLFIIPFLVIAIPDGHWRLAFALILLAGVSDSLDGLLARLLKQRTRLGEFLDPITDKLLLSTLFLVLTHVGAIPRYVTVLVFSRDLGIVVIAAVLYITNTLREFEPSLFGKLNTFVQIVAVVGIMADHVFQIPYLTAITGSLLQVVAVLAPLSAAQYAWIVVRKVSVPVSDGPVIDGPAGDGPGSAGPGSQEPVGQLPRSSEGRPEIEA